MSNEQPIVCKYEQADDATQARYYEQQGAYAECVVEYGEQEAQRRYPDWASHLAECRECAESMRNVVVFVRSSE